MAKLEKPRGLTINFKPSPRQYELWKALQPGKCECGGDLEMRPCGFNSHGQQVYKATCTKCGTTDIPEQILGGGACGGGKALLLNELVLTPTGFKKVIDLKIGDKIISATTGEETSIIYLHPIEEREYYKLTFMDGTEIECSDNHLWNVHVTNRYRKQEIKLTKDIYEWYRQKKQGKYKRNWLAIPISAPIKFSKSLSEKPKKIHPYVLGALIANGCMTACHVYNHNITFCSMDPETVQKLEDYGIVFYKFYQKPGCKAKDYHIRDSNLIHNLAELGLTGKRAQNKFIPDLYKFGTIEERKMLIAGMVDCDGTINKNGSMSYSTTSKQLAEDFAFVIRSLGGIAYIRYYKSSYQYQQTGEYAYCYRVLFRTEFNKELFALPRKQTRCRDNYVYLAKRIEKIEKVGKRYGRCISIQHPSGLFIAGEGFQVTHNSYLGCAWVASSCIRFPGIRMVIARKERTALLQSTWKTLMDLLKQWGLERDVNFKVDNVRHAITFWNGSEILSMHLAPSPGDPNYESLGSLEITSCFIDEVSEVPEKAVEVLASRIRYKVEDTFIVGKMFMSCNPSLSWVRGTFVMDENHQPVTLPPGYRYIPFSLFDNPDEKFRSIYYNKLMKLRNPADRNRLLYGNWVFAENNTLAAYSGFDGDKHLVDRLKDKLYDPLKPLILSCDWNVAPYMSCLPLQIDFENKKIYIFPEYIGYPKDKLNNTPAFSKYIAGQLTKDGHIGGVLITGDPAGAARSTLLEEGANNYTIFVKNMTTDLMHPKVQLLSKQPAQITRLEFVNELLNGYQGWQIQIDARCHRLIEDFSYQKKNPDGTKEKKKIVNEHGERVERWGHFSDCFDYALVYYLNKEYSAYRTNNADIVTTIDRGTQVYGDFEF